MGSQSQSQSQKRPPASLSPSPGTLGRIALPLGARGVLVGKTGTGKSTLEEALIAEWLRTHGDKARVLILDSKPRFRAAWELNGLPARRRYKKWGYGTPMPDSVVLPLRHPAAELKETWRLGHRVAIAQGDLGTLDWLMWALDRFYADSHAKYHQLVAVDEASDYFSSTGLTGRGNAILKAVRSGREKGLAVLACTQRPKGLPKSLLTEATNLYLFDLAFRQDLEHLREMGLPEDARVPAAEHAFYFYSHAAPQAAGFYRLGGAGKGAA